MFTIEEIKYYLEGCRLINAADMKSLVTENQTLNYAIHELEDYEDGIKARLERRHDPRRK